MTKKSSKKPASPPTRDDIVLIALKMAAKRGWAMTGLNDIAQAAKIPLADLREIFEDKTDILVHYGRMIDRHMLAVATEFQPETPLRERLFELIMARLDVMNEHRAGVCAVLESLPLDPKQAVIALPHLCRSMLWMMEAAGIESGGARGAARLVGLTAVYARVLWVWRGDDTADMARSMAALDKALDQAERAASMLGL